MTNNDMPRRLKKNEHKQEDDQERESLLREHNDKIEREKHLIMYLGVGFFMVMFVGLWFVSFTGAVKNSMPEDKTGESISEVLTKLKVNLDKTKNEIDQARNNLAQTNQVTSTSMATTSKELDIDNLNIEISKDSINSLKTNLEKQAESATVTPESQLPINK